MSAKKGTLNPMVQQLGVNKRETLHKYPHFTLGNTDLKCAQLVAINS